jgi:HEAT repeat protein
MRALQDPRVDVAALACLGIGRLRDARAVTMLNSLASDAARPLRIRRAAIAGLSLTGDRAATPALLALAESGDDELELAAAAALGTLRDPRTLTALLTRALIPRRAGALESLDSRSDGPGLSPLTPEGDIAVPGALGAALREVVGAVLDRVAALLDDPDPATQSLAIRVLVKSGDVRVTPTRLAAAANSKTQVLRDAAVFAAGWQSRHVPDLGPATAQALAGVLAEASGWERKIAAVAALSALGAAGAPHLERGLQDESPLVRAAAATALASTEAATPALIAAADDPVAAVRAAVAQALGGRRSPAARAALERLAKDDSARVRRAAVPAD